MVELGMRKNSPLVMGHGWNMLLQSNKSMPPTIQHVVFVSAIVNDKSKTPPDPTRIICLHNLFTRTHTNYEPATKNQRVSSPNSNKNIQL